MSTLNGGPRPFINTNGLVLNLDAGNTLSYPGSGTTWTDLSGNGLNATLNNGPTFDSANGGNLSFDGTDDYGSIPDSNTIDFSTSVSICVWLNRVGNVTLAEEIVIHKESGISPTGGFQLSVNGNNGSYSLRVRSASNVNDTFVGNSGTITVGNWNFLCLTYSSGTIIGYINGFFDSSKSTSVSSLGNNNNGLGICSVAASVAVGNVGNFKIASINLYNRVLSPTEIYQNYYALKSRFEL